MPQFEVYNLLLCYNYFNGYAIQITNFIFSIIGSSFVIYGSARIPFHIDVNIYKFFFSINIPYFIFIIIFNIVFLLFRCTDLMNNGANLWAFGLSIIQIYVSIFGLITNIINDTMIFYNLYNYQKLSKEKNSNKYPLLTKGEISNTKFILTIIFLIWINILFLCISDSILINLGINGSYSKYCSAIKKEELFNSQNNEVKPKKPKKPKKVKKQKNQKFQKFQKNINNGNTEFPIIDKNNNNKDISNNKNDKIKNEKDSQNDLHDSQNPINQKDGNLIVNEEKK